MKDNVAHKFTLIVNANCFSRPLKIPFEKRVDALIAYSQMSSVMTEAEFVIEDYCYYLDDCNTMKYSTFERMK